MARTTCIPISRVRLAILYRGQCGCCAGCFKPLGEDGHVEPSAHRGKALLIHRPEKAQAA